MTVFNYPLGVAGTLDMIVLLPGLAIGRAGRFIPGDGVTICVDVKTGKNPDVTWREQIAAYRHAPECRARPVRHRPRTRCPPPTRARSCTCGPSTRAATGCTSSPVPTTRTAWNMFRRDVEIFTGPQGGRRQARQGLLPAPRGRHDPAAAASPTWTAKATAGRSPRSSRPGVDADLEQLAAMDAGDCLKVKGIGGKLLDIIRVMLADHGLHLAGEAPEIG